MPTRHSLWARCWTSPMPPMPGLAVARLGDFPSGSCRLGALRHLARVAGEGAVVGERGGVVAGVALVGAGAAAGLVDREAGQVGRQFRQVEVGQQAAAYCRREGVEGRLDPGDAAVGVVITEEGPK